MQSPPNDRAPAPLSLAVSDALNEYFRTLNGAPPESLYELVLAQVEPPLLRAVLAHCRGNQSKAADVLGLNRATLRKKLLQYRITPKAIANAIAANRAHAAAQASAAAAIPPRFGQPYAARSVRS